MAGVRLAISSMSLGRCFAGHDLADRLDMAQKYGYEGIELFYEDLCDYALRLSPDKTANEPPDACLVEAARQIYDMCAVRSLEVVCLQPFMHYEGLVDRAEHRRRVKQFEVWLTMAQGLHTDLIAIPSSFLPASQVSGNMDLIVSDLRELADLAARALPPIRLSYESLAWGTHCNTWEKSWEVVKRVDRPNFGLCLDTFNIAGRIYADPASPMGVVPGAQEAVRQSMARLISQVDSQRVFFVQVVDAEKLREPLVKGHRFYDPTQPARMSWSRNCRLFYGEADRGAYLPVSDISSAIFNGLGYCGWVSLELFNRRMSDKGAEVPEELARRGAMSFNWLQHDMNHLAHDFISHRGLHVHSPSPSL